MNGNFICSNKKLEKRWDLFLCHVIGNANGLGRQRMKELYDSCNILSKSKLLAIDEGEKCTNSDVDPKKISNQCVNHGRVVIVNDENLQDSMSMEWKSEFIIPYIHRYCQIWDIDVVSSAQ